MPADRPNIGTGRRRQGDTDPDRRDDRNRSLERAIGREATADEEYERGRQPGAYGDSAPHDPSPVKPPDAPDER